MDSAPYLSFLLLLSYLSAAYFRLLNVLWYTTRSALIFDVCSENLVKWEQMCSIADRTTHSVALTNGLIDTLPVVHPSSVHATFHVKISIITVGTLNGTKT